jgi:hypothetical protein
MREKPEARRSTNLGFGTRPAMRVICSPPREGRNWTYLFQEPWSAQKVAPFALARLIYDRIERSCVPSQAHSHCRRVPARGSKLFKRRTLRRSLVKVIRLWIELGGKALDVFPAYMLLKRIPTHTSSNPFDHGSSHACATCALTTAPSTQRPKEDQRRRDAGHGTDGMQPSPCLQ